MAKPLIVATGVIGVFLVAGGVFLATRKDSNKNEPSTSSTSQKEQNTQKSVSVDDPSGLYNYFSDPSVTKHIDNGATFGNGQTLVFEYDGSKTNNDEYATLSYQLYYVQDNGGVIPMGGGNLEGRGSGEFTLSDSVFNSNAKDRSGYLELQGTYTEGTSGTSVVLGMYPIKFDVSE